MSIMRELPYLQSSYLPHLSQLILLQLILLRPTLHKSSIIGRRNVSMDECTTSSSATILFLHSTPPIGNQMKKFKKRSMKRLRRMRNSNQSLNECANQLFPLLPIIQGTTLLLIQMQKYLQYLQQYYQLQHLRFNIASLQLVRATSTSAIWKTALLKFALQLDLFL
jgi:hypothetical protein